MRSSSRHVPLLTLAAVLAAVPLADARAAPRAGDIQVGDVAPAIVASGWLGGEAPEMEGKAKLLEFWGTWCAPCVASMPHVQDLWVRYREQGLVVVALSYEAPDAMTGFLEEHGYTMPVASDPERASVEAYGVKVWPTTFVIGADGRVLYRGSPAGAEPYVQQALGLETSPEALLDAYLAGGEGATAALERLPGVATRDFALGTWAASRGGEAARRAPKDPGGALSAWAVGGELRRQAALDELAAATDPFDLKDWAERELAARFPIEDEALLALIEDGKYADAVSAIVARNPSAKALGKAKGDDGLRDWCHERVKAQREHARLAVLLAEYVWGPLKEPEQIAMPPGVGIRMDKDPDTGTDRFVGVQLPDGSGFLREEFPAAMHAFLRRTAAIEMLDRRKPPKDLDKAAAKLHADLLDALKADYGRREDGED